ncbi:hypothetical protein [Rhizobium sp. Leaf262]|uniref:hypothetical protein n=1 Tax=Rhizobium sp. Leaf262 TaxID=1736312 RepID=UPI000713BBA9|nr:hypothetical protein [Rhizobium sp. Leaf262]KQO83758.1 hypothetical protein ASF29_02875 [Rhizobium sp. Leaf262]
MPRYRSYTCAIFICLTTLLSGCDILGFHSWQWNQKVTIVVETPGGVRTGDSVQSVVWSESPHWSKIGDSGGWFTNDLKGEAAFVEVAPNKYLFALLKTYDHPAVDKVFRPQPVKRPYITADGFRNQIRAENEAIQASRETREVPRASFPTLVTFTKPTDPSTAVKVEPENLEAAFGNGYRLVSIRLGITSEPLTTGRVVKVLGTEFSKIWTEQIQENIRIYGPFSQIPFALKITPSQFRRGG